MYTPKLFISCPMRGLTDEMIKANREKMHKIAEIVFDQELEVIPSYIIPAGEVPEGVMTSMWYLGRSIQMMSEADYYIGVNMPYGYSNACVIENDVAVTYGLQRYLVDSSILNLPKRTFYNEKNKNK